MVNLAISDELFDKLSQIAVSRQMPVEKQVEELLTEGIARRSRADSLRRMFDDIAALTPRDVPQTDSTILLREDRDR